MANRTCYCAACHNTFTGITPFDKHQLLSGGKVTCLDPVTARRADGALKFGIWRYAPDGRPVWGRALLTGETRDVRFRPGAREIPALQDPPGRVMTPQPFGA